MIAVGARTRVSITELEQFVTCRMEWYYAQKLGLRPKPEEKTVSPTLSGSAIHFGLEAGMNRGRGENPVVVALNAATTFLEAHGEGAGRYMKGAQQALLGVPENYWESENHVSEQKIEVDYEAPNGCLVQVVGKPDIWFHDENGIVIVDAKSSGKDEHERALAYQQWNLQVHYYSVLLEDWLTEQGKVVPPIYVKHTVLSTRGKHFYGQPYLMGKNHREKIRQRMLRIAGEIASVHDQEMDVFTDGRIEYMCKGCDFAELDTLALTGRPIDSMIKEYFTTREDRSVLYQS